MKNKGFTIVEMLIVIPIVLLVLGVFIGSIISITGEVLVARGNNSMIYNIQDTFDKIKNDLATTGGFLATNNITLVSPQGYNNDTTAFDNASTTTGVALILNAYATTSNPNSSFVKNIVYASSQPNQCNSTMLSSNTPIMINIVYFTKAETDGSTSLWRRIIMPSGYSSFSCSKPWQQPTCAIGQTGANCLTNDTKLVDHIATNGFTVKYYDSSTSTTELSTASDGSQSDATRQISISTARSIEVTITTSSTVAGKSISQTMTSRFSNSNTNTSATTVPTACPSGFIRVPGSATYGTSDFCVMKYEAKQSSTTVPISQASGTPWVSISQTNAITYSANVAGCTGCHLISSAEWMTIAQNIALVASNWSSGVVGTGYIFSGHNDGSPASTITADASDSNGYSGTGNSSGDTTTTNAMVGNSQKRTLTLSNGEIIWDLAGNAAEWTSGQITGNQPGIAAGGYAWRDFTALTSFGITNPNLLPGGTNIASSSLWTGASNGIGQIYSSTEETALMGIWRGGNYGQTVNGGIFSVVMNSAPTTTQASIGFRVAR